MTQYTVKITFPNNLNAVRHYESDTDIKDLLKPIAGFIVICGGEPSNVFTITFSPLAEELNVVPEKLLEKLLGYFPEPVLADPRNLSLESGDIILRSEKEGDVFTYEALLFNTPIYRFQIRNQNDIPKVVQFLHSCNDISDMLSTFLESVKKDFPALSEDLADIGTVNVDSTVPEMEKTVQPREELKKEDFKELGILLCQLGGPQLELIVRSPIAHQLKSETFIQTIRQYLTGNGTIIKGDMGRAVVIVSDAQKGNYESVIRSALLDHNALDGAVIDREEYHLGKEIPGRIYL